MGTRSITVFALLLGLLVGLSPAEARWFGDEDDIVNPWAAASPSGEFHLSVMPSAADGSGPATYTMKREGKVLWKTEHPFTLREGAVTDKGEVAGYAYSHGKEGRWHKDGEQSTLNAVILNELGMVRLNDARPRHDPPVMANPPADYQPTAWGVIVNDVADRLLIRTRDSWGRKRAWWIYRLSDGEHIKDADPVKEPIHERIAVREIRCETIPGTDLVALQWLVMDFTEAPGRFSAEIAVHTLEGAKVWSRVIADEWTDWGEAPGQNTWQLGRERFRQLWTNDHSLAFTSRALGERLINRLERDPASEHGWRVREEPSEPWDPATLCLPGAESLMAVELERLGSVQLKTGGAESQIRDIRDMDIDVKGRIGFLRTNIGGSPPDLVFIESGRVIRDISLEQVLPGRWSDYTIIPLADGMWSALSFGSPDFPPASVLIDPRTGTTRSWDHFPKAPLIAQAAMPDGGLVGLASNRMGVPGGVARSTADATVAWVIPFGSAKSVTVTTRGEIAVLDATPSRSRICFVGDNGELLREYSVARVLGREPSYPAGLTADTDGGVILFDSNGLPPFIRVSAEGKVIDQFRARYADGRNIPTRAVHRSPDGSLWTHDGDAIFRLDDTGAAIEVIGTPLENAQLTTVETLCVGADDLIYAQDRRTKRIHAFDSEGNIVRELRPAPEDYSERGWFGHLAVGRDGTVWAAKPAEGPRSEYVRFEPDGTRAGIDRLPHRHWRQTLYARPVDDLNWIVSPSRIWLLDRAGRAAREISRQPNGGWLRIGRSASAADGSLAVASQGAWHVFDRNGEPVGSVGFWDAEFRLAVRATGAPATNGDWIAENDLGMILLYRVSQPTQPPVRFHPPRENKQQSWWDVLFSPDGRELWIRNADSFTIERYRLPD